MVFVNYNFMFLFLISLLLSFMSFTTSSPLKSSFMLLASLLCFIFGAYNLVSFWFNYFIIFLFLSGIFVVLLYLAGLSWEGFYTPSFFLVVGFFMVCLWFFGVFIFSPSFLLTGFNFNFLVFWIFLFSLILLLLIFMSVVPTGQSLRKLNFENMF